MHNIPGYGYPIAIGVGLVAFGAILRHHDGKSPRGGGWLHRVSMAAFVAGAFLLTVGVTPWQDALAALTGTGAGLVALLIVAFFAGLGTWYEWRHEHMKKRARAHAFAIVTGTSLMMIIGNGARLLRAAATSPARTGRALVQSVSRISSGHAAHSMSTHSALALVSFGAVAAVVLITAASKSGGKGGGRSAPKAITTGQPALPATRKGG